MTLVEIMVAIAITVGMMLLIGNVFKSATDASGSALALNDVNGQVRVVTEQLQNDFAGFQTDLPFAIIFQAHQNHPTDPLYNPNDDRTWLGDPDDPDPFDPTLPAQVIRYDRICFFASGNFEPPVESSILSGNLARIFYGQILDSPDLQLENDVAAPRQILTRRQKIMTTSPFLSSRSVGDYSWVTTPADYDDFPFEFTPTSLATTVPGSPTTLWKNVPVVNYFARYFNDLPDAIGSFVRRPIYDEIYMHPRSLEAQQRLQLMSDVTDFKIQLYLEDQIQGRWRWFPDDHDMLLYPDRIFAFYWNVPDMDYTNNPTMIPSVLLDREMNVRRNVNIPWYSPIDTVDVKAFFPDMWPKAIRFTFTLYDKNRRRFPEGQTFSYIVKVPSKY
jgi:type II secretory pathway pseudopilin PulG